LSTFHFTLNDTPTTVDAPDDMPLLWVLRDRLQLRGTKYGCGRGFCGSCTVLVDGSAQRSCITRMSRLHGSQVTTIEGLDPDGAHPLQRAWIAEQVPQCGYCQPGQIMNAASLLASNPRPDRQEITAAMDRVLCRCGTYQRIRRAIERCVREG
jgi:isoquinoline 1-oxidoreductase alpha subunit